MKRCLAFLLAVLLIAALIPATAAAEGRTYKVRISPANRVPFSAEKWSNTTWPTVTV
jgi:hypothetical protein